MSSGKTIGIIGNSPVSQILTLLLGRDNKVYRIVDKKDEKPFMPFYPNDTTLGILKRIGQLSGIDLSNRGDSMNLYIAFGKESSIYCGGTMRSFQEVLETAYEKDREALETFFQEVETIGKEWRAFIENDFNSKGISMNTSARYVATTVGQRLKKTGVTSSDIQDIMFALLPVEDVTFPVFAGYIYTQFFDNNRLKKNLWKEILKGAETLGMRIPVGNMDNLTVSPEDATASGKSLVPESMDLVIDLRPSLLVEDGTPVNVKKKVWGGIFQWKGMEPDRIYSIRLSEHIFFRIWPDLYGEEKAFQWNFEALLADGMEQTEKSLKEWLAEALREEGSEKIKVSKIYNPSYFAEALDSPHGYSWAFNRSQSMCDPTHLFKKEKEPYKKSGYWGFAWFSAALDIWDAIENQISWNRKYKIETNETR